MSIILHPKFDVSYATLVPIATSLALCIAIEKILKIKPELKWPDKRPRLLKELPHSVKQKNPISKNRIKIPARNKKRSSLGKVHIPDGKARAKSWPSAWPSGKELFTLGFDKEGNGVCPFHEFVSADCADSKKGKLICAICG